MIGQIILQIIIIALSAAFTCADTAAVSVSDSRIEKLAASGNRKAACLKKLFDRPTDFLSGVRTALKLTGFIGAAFAADSFALPIASAIEETSIGIPVYVLQKAAAVAVTLVFAYFNILFGELVPKRAAMKNPEKTALAMSGFIAFFTGLFTPFVKLLNLSATSILHLFGVDPESDDGAVTEEEILMMSDAGAEKGTIDEDENRIIKNIFAFDDMTAGQICTHRTEASVLWSTDDTSVWEETIHRTRHSVFPVCGESVDNVIGILDAKSYFRLDNKTRENIMSDAVREPFFVHENMKADRLFEQMKQRGADHFAVVVDEYGGMSGIITITDLVEELVGDFADDDSPEPLARFEKIGDNKWIVPGITPLNEVCEALEIALPADKYETFGEYVIAELGEIPKDGSQLGFDSDSLHIDVLVINHHRIELCRVEKIKIQQTESE